MFPDAMLPLSCGGVSISRGKKEALSRLFIGDLLGVVGSLAILRKSTVAADSQICPT